MEAAIEVKDIASFKLTIAKDRRAIKVPVSSTEEERESAVRFLKAVSDKVQYAGFTIRGHYQPKDKCIFLSGGLNEKTRQTFKFRQEFLKPKPLHKHDCDNCKYLGSDDEHDYYFCHREGEHPILSTLIARFGELGDYSSGLSFVMSSRPLNTALMLADEQRVLPDDVKKYVKEKQDNWLEYCKTDLKYADDVARLWEGKKRFTLK